MLVNVCFLLILIRFHLVSTQVRLCEVQTSCDQCMKASASCRWCSNQDFKGKRCNTEENLIKQGCAKQFILNNDSNVREADAIKTEYYTISPRQVFVLYRKNFSFSFNISVTLNSYLPVETVILQDFSFSMQPVFYELNRLIKNMTIEGLKRGVTKFGLAKFIDKVNYPIIDPNKYDKTQKALNNPFNFAIIAPLSSDPDFLLYHLSEQQISGNLDIPEAALDGLVQTVVCPQMGWSKGGDVLKTVVIITDEFTKLVTDARIVGIMKPHDLKCHVNEELKDLMGMEVDYPSIAQTASVLRASKTEVIFAVASNVLQHYENLQKAWVGINSVVTKLDVSNFNLLDIIFDSREELNGKIGVTYSDSDDHKIKITPHCKNFSGAECYGVRLNDTVLFTVDVQFLKPEGIGGLEFYISSLDAVSLEYEQIDECECSRETAVKGKCQNGGMETCGACTCIEPFGGSLCECDKTKVTKETMCLDPKTQTICGGKGTCDDCGKCICYTADDGRTYEGQYCECGRSQCGEFEGLLCGGPERGECVCETCQCKEKYEGKACQNLKCDSEELKLQCKAPNSTIACSNNGTCICGQCTCNIGSTGKYCETEVKTISCDMYEDAVSCFLNQVPVDETKDCANISMPIEAVSGCNFQCVRVDSKNCKMYYNYTLEGEKVTNITVKVRDAEADCVEPVNIALITGIIFILIILIGIILFGLYFLSLYLYYRADYKRFVRETQAQGVGTTNPLYESTG